MRKRKRFKRISLKCFSEKLNTDLPKSEIWFQKHWKEKGIECESDECNKPWGKIIPDVVNHKYKYVIEIDGTWHRKRSQKKKDLRKDSFYKKHGYDVFRLDAYSEAQLLACIECIERIRAAPMVVASKVILRKRKTFV